MPIIKSLYDVHPGLAMVRKWIETMPEKTGRSLKEWTALIKNKGPKTTKERREWLKKEHKLGTNSAGWLVDYAEGTNKELADPGLYLDAAEKYVEDMYGGGKAHLRPLHEALYKLCKSIAKDVRCCPCQTIVPFYRNHVIAQINPRMPRTHGDGLIHVRQFHATVEVDEPLPEVAPHQPTPEEQAIGRHCASRNPA